MCIESVMSSLTLLSVLWALLGTLAAAWLYLLLRRSSASGGALRNDFLMLESSINASAHGLVFMDKKGSILRCNAHASHFIPPLADAQSGLKTFQDVVAYMFDYAVEGDESLESAAAKVSLTRGEGAGFREVLRLDDGRYCLAQAQKTVFGTVVILSDITRQRKREEELVRLSRANRDLIAAVEETTNGFVISDPKRHGNPITFVNEAFCRSINLPREKILGRSWKDLMKEIGDSRAVEKAKTLEQSAAPVDIELQLAAGDSGMRCYSLRISSTLDPRKGVGLFIGVLSDITDLRSSEAQLFQMQKLESLGHLAGGIAHDFNNVLSIIDGYARLSLNAAGQGSTVAGHLEKVIRAVERGAALTRQLLTFGRRKIVVEGVVDLCQTLIEQKIMLRPLLGAAFELVVQVPEENLYVECGADEIGQIVMNLVINGRDAMEQGGRIVVEARTLAPEHLPPVIPDAERTTAFANISITDHGTGMSDETVKKIFDPFFTTKGAGKGTGLGLSIVYGMVRNMRGYIDVDSRPGVGTTMKIYLPLTDKRPASLPHKSISMESGQIRFDGYTALVAEDEPDLLDLLSGMLERLGMNVLRAPNGDAALAIQDEYEGTIDFLITDVVMPELNGEKLAELFLALRPDAKVIFMSGYPTSGNLAPVDLPADAYFMAKPISYDALAVMLRERIEGEGSGGLRQAQGTTRHWS